MMQIDLVGFHPLPIRLLPGNPGFQFSVINDPSLQRIDQKYLARLQPALIENSRVGNIQNSHFGSHDHQAVFGHQVTGGSETVTIQDSADTLAIGESDGGWAVPWLHQTSVVLIKALLVGIHANILVPRLGDQHHDGVGQRTPTGH